MSATKPSTAAPAVDDTNATRVFVGNIPWKMSAGEVRGFFSAWGDIVDMRYKGRGIAFLTYADAGSATSVINEWGLHASKFRMQDKELLVQRQKRKPPTKAEEAASHARVVERLRNKRKRKQERIYRKLLKTELCNEFMHTGSCQWGDACKFAHGDADLNRGEEEEFRKTELCNEFQANGKCSKGDKCFFAHGEADLRELRPGLKAALLASRDDMEKKREASEAWEARKKARRAAGGNDDDAAAEDRTGGEKGEVEGSEVKESGAEATQEPPAKKRRAAEPVKEEEEKQAAPAAGGAAQ